jgi:hypothetical protein
LNRCFRAHATIRGQRQDVSRGRASLFTPYAPPLRKIAS